jgi:PPOX class probable F420-dependent enzyme
MTTDLDNARYILFTTFRKDGTSVSSPVWVVAYNNGYAFNTAADSFKVKRLKKNSTVTVAPSNVKGALKPGATTHHGTAEVVSGDENIKVNAIIKMKYRMAYPLLIGTGEMWRKIRRKPPEESVAILITLTD